MPETLRLLVRLLEALATKPFKSVVRPATRRVEDAFRGAATVREPAMVEDAGARKPLVRVARLLTMSVDEALSGPLIVSGPFTVDEAEAMKPELSVTSPATDTVDEAVRAPVTESVLPILDDAFAMKPAESVASPATSRLPEALTRSTWVPFTARPSRVELDDGVELGFTTSMPLPALVPRELPVKLKLPKASETGM